MNPLALQFASGNVFFIGLGMVVIAAAFFLCCSQRWLKSLTTILSLVGIGLVILSATPLPIWLYVLWLIPCLAGLILYNLRAVLACSVQFRLILFAVNTFSSALFLAPELPYHKSPIIVVSSLQPCYVIGDSLSASTGPEDRPWPMVLGDLSHLTITNLAHPGATAESALQQAAQITNTDSLIFIELGGNDLLSGASAEAFAQNLDHLLVQLSAATNQLVMFEIPLAPFRNAYGAAQRRLAKKYHAILLPKKFLTRIFALEDATTDGLHFSQLGHDCLAKSLARIIKTAPDAAVSK